jgi:para-nitrobenzyl esterase
MKKLVQGIFGVIAFFFAILTPLSIKAQATLGCDGNRYIKDVFTDTTQKKGVLYGRNNVSGVNIGLLMDVVEPKGDALAKRPLIILAFGGGFVQGARNEKYMLDICQTFAKKGYVCATIDYRLYDLLKGFPDSLKITPTIVGAIHDMKAAIRFFRKDAAAGNTFKIDTNNIIVGGLSAGAITAMHVAHLDSTDVIAPWLRTIVGKEGGFEGNSGNAGFSSSVKGAISLSGGLYQKEYIDANDVPFIAYHGTTDVVVPFGYGLNVYGFYTDGDSSCNTYARSLGIRSSLITVKGGGHTDIYDITGKYGAQYVDFLVKSSIFTKQLVCGETLTLPTQDIDNQAIKVFPNPSGDVMTLSFDKNMLSSNDISEGYRLTVMDALGRQVFDSGKQYSETFDLNKSAFGRGFFIARVTIGSKNARIVKKIVFE